MAKRRSKQEEQVQGQGQTGQEQGGTVVGEFAGPMPEYEGTETFLALIAEDPQEGGGNSRNVTAYLTDGKQLSEWPTRVKGT